MPDPLNLYQTPTNLSYIPAHKFLPLMLKGFQTGSKVFLITSVLWTGVKLFYGIHDKSTFIITFDITEMYCCQYYIQHLERELQINYKELKSFYFINIKMTLYFYDTVEVIYLPSGDWRLITRKGSDLPKKSFLSNFTPSKRNLKYSLIIL